MTSIKDINSLEKDKLNLQIQLNNILKSNNPNQDKINELKSEILYIDKQISKKVGINELNRLNEIKNKKFDIYEKNKHEYFTFKNRYKKINKMKVATARMIGVIENLNNENINNIRIVKVK